jgi:hypothetical protein
MKSSRKIIILSLVSAGIIIFWLIPGINKAKETRYVRYVENVDAPEAHVHSLDATLQSDTTREKRKVYNKEVIEPAKTKKVSAEMFSRATHYEAVEPMIEVDSVLELVEKSDSLVVIQ